MAWHCCHSGATAPHLTHTRDNASCHQFVKIFNEMLKQQRALFVNVCNAVSKVRGVGMACVVMVGI